MGVPEAVVEEPGVISRATAEAVQRLNLVPVPTIALVQGGCFGGGTGVVSACDVVIAADNAVFSIDGNSLKTAAVFNFEAKSGYSIRVKTTESLAQMPP